MVKSLGLLVKRKKLQLVVPQLGALWEWTNSQVVKAVHAYPTFQASSSGWYFLFLMHVFIFCVYRLFSPYLCWSLILPPSLVLEFDFALVKFIFCDSTVSKNKIRNLTRHGFTCLELNVTWYEILHSSCIITVINIVGVGLPLPLVFPTSRPFFKVRVCARLSKGKCKVLIWFSSGQQIL